MLVSAGMFGCLVKSVLQFLVGHAFGIGQVLGLQAQQRLTHRNNRHALGIGPSGQAIGGVVMQAARGDVFAWFGGPFAAMIGFVADGGGQQPVAQFIAETVPRLGKSTNSLSSSCASARPAAVAIFWIIAGVVAPTTAASIAWWR